jgi:hypothetical protein
MKVGWSTALVFVACLSPPTLAWADGTTSPGKNSVFLSASGLSLQSGLQTASLLTATINKGKKKTVVAVEGMLTDIGQTSGPRTEHIWTEINGIGIEPETSNVSYVAQVNCPTITISPFSGLCTVTGTWWLDIDAAEAAHPGMFVGQPLNITLMGQELTGNGDVGLVATLTARVQKK